jgi:hypothetical protein
VSRRAEGRAKPTHMGPQAADLRPTFCGEDAVTITWNESDVGRCAADFGLAPDTRSASLAACCSPSRCAGAARLGTLLGTLHSCILGCRCQQGFVTWAHADAEGCRTKRLDFDRAKSITGMPDDALHMPAQELVDGAEGSFVITASCSSLQLVAHAQALGEAT